ncbi:DUF6879 family protein [Nonomuraea sp. NPDC048882]|uniref:DUF6879 family protein n=1 Tax=Nonomuraea sp. NPDC048882 TaxID=3154347 RepID=UPI0033DD0208
MIQGRPIAPERFGDTLQQFKHTAFRLELQPSYLVPEETKILAAFLKGEPRSPVPVYQDWYNQVAEGVRQGKRIERVRVQDDPPTPYQRFERWLDAWNVASGEIMRYLTRQQAFDIGLLPDAGSTDWWLLDSSQLIIMRFDEAGRPGTHELVDDPAVVVQACAWRDLAVHHSVLSTPDAPAD